MSDQGVFTSFHRSTVCCHYTSPIMLAIHNYLYLYILFFNVTTVIVFYVSTKIIYKSRSLCNLYKSWYLTRISDSLKWTQRFPTYLFTLFNFSIMLLMFKNILVLMISTKILHCVLHICSFSKTKTKPRNHHINTMALTFRY